MEGPSSFVSRARTAIHSAASKAEKVFTDINNKNSSNHNQQSEDFGSQPESHYNNNQSSSKDNKKGKNKGVRPNPIKTKQDWQERFRTLRIGNKKEAADIDNTDNTMAYAIFDDNLYMMGEKEFAKDSDQGVATDDSQAVNRDIIPSSAIVKQLAIAVEAAFNYNSMNDLLASSRGSSPVRERASLGISAVKSLVLREDKLAREFGSSEKVLSVIHALLNPEGQFTGRTLSNLEAQTSATSLIKELRGAPIESFVVKLSEAFGCLKTTRKMSAFWSRVVSELRRLWCEGQYIPGIPPDNLPDLNSCLLYQQLQVFNCCISRKRRHNAAVESLERVTSQDGSSSETAALQPSFYARTKSGEPVLRLGADKECDHLTLLETGELVYSPIMQEPPLLTEDVIKENEEFVLRTGSCGAGCSQLLSDMQAFKAANPGCILEDFIRWHSPPDWLENDSSIDDNDTSNGGDLSSVKGQLSSRMQKEGNLWRELWETSKPVPAVRQSPIYDEDLAVEGILDSLDDISPSDLFKQLFIVALGSGLAIAESIISTNSSLIKMFNDCKNYIVGTCQGNIWMERLDDICQVYETVESMLLNEDEFLKTVNQADETSPVAGDQPRNRFKKLSLIFGTGRSKSSPHAKDSKSNDGSPKTFSLFSKKPPKPLPSPTDKSASNAVENDWTIV